MILDLAEYSVKLAKHLLVRHSKVNSITMRDGYFLFPIQNINFVNLDNVFFMQMGT